MSKRITITIDEDISDVDALECVLYAVKQGRISHDSKGNEFYCWGIAFPNPDPDKEWDFPLTLWTNRSSKAPNSSFRITHYKNNESKSNSNW